MTTIDHLAFPHVFEAIFSYASPTVPVRLRLTCRDCRDKVDSIFKSALVVESSSPVNTLAVDSSSTVDTFITTAPHGFGQSLHESHTTVRRFIASGPHVHSDTLIDKVYLTPPYTCWHIKVFASKYILHIATHSWKRNYHPIRLDLGREVRHVALVFRPNLDPMERPRSDADLTGGFFCTLIDYIAPVLARGGTVTFVGLEGVHPSYFDSTDRIGRSSSRQRVPTLQFQIQPAVRLWFDLLFSARGTVCGLGEDEADEIRKAFCPKEGWKRQRDALKGLTFATLEEWMREWKRSWGMPERK